MIDQELLNILACPETKEPVRMAEESLVTQVNGLIQAGKLQNLGGEKVREPIDGGLIRKDGKVLYPIRDEIPIMLVEESIALPLKP